MFEQPWKNKLCLMLTGAFLLLQPTGAFAAALELSLDDSIAQALQNNSTIKMAASDREKAKWGIKEAESGQLPSVALSSSAARSKNSSSVESSDNFNNSVKLNWQLYSGGRVEGVIKQAKLNDDIADLGIVKTRQQVILDTTTAYFTVLQNRNMVKVSQDTVDSLTQHLTNVQAQFDAGVVAKGDVLRSEVELSNAQQNLTKAQNSYELAIANLNNIIGVPLDTETSLKNDLTYVAYDVSLDDSVQLALKNRPEVSQSEANMAIAKTGVKIADSGRLPTVNLSVADSKSGAEFPGNMNNWSASVMANWNIFDAGVTSAKIKQAEATVDKTAEQDKEMKSNIELEVRQSYLSMKEAEKRINTTQVAVDKAAEDLKISQAKYYAGVGTNLDVIDAQLSLTQAKTNYTQSLYDYATNKAKLEKATAVGIN